MFDFRRQPQQRHVSLELMNANDTRFYTGRLSYKLMRRRLFAKLDRLMQLCRMIVFLLATAWAASLTAADHISIQAHPKLQKQAANSWQRIDQGGVTAPSGILAYSGGWYDSDHHQLCIFGGGHWNYSGNEVWCFDIAQLRWRQLYTADAIVEGGKYQGAYLNFNKRYPGALFNPAGEDIADARPMSKHTYDQMEYIPGLGALVWGGYSWGDGSQGWCDSCPDTWAFDFGTQKWLYLYKGNNPSPNGRSGDAGVGSSAYVPADRLLYVVSRGKTWTFTPGTLKWRQLDVSGQPPWSIEATLEYDSKRHSLYFFGGNYPENGQLYHFDIKKRHWQTIKATGTQPGLQANNGPGLAYSPDHDALMLYQSGQLWAYHPAQQHWEKLKTTNNPQDRSYVFGRFRYDPVNKGFWLHNWQDGKHQTWFYRYR